MPKVASNRTKTQRAVRGWDYCACDGFCVVFYGRKRYCPNCKRWVSGKTKKVKVKSFKGRSGDVDPGELAEAA